MTATTPTPEPMPELLPCPFCGGDSSINKISPKKVEIKCTRCFVKRTQRCLRFSVDWLMGEMARKWNQRADLSRPAVVDYNWRDSDARIKRVMEAFGFPDSNSLYSLLKQMENEIQHSLASPQPPAEDLRKVREALKNFNNLIEADRLINELGSIVQGSHAHILIKRVIVDMAEAQTTTEALTTQGWRTDMENAPRDGKTELLLKDNWGVISHVVSSEDMGGCWKIINHDDDLRLNPMFQKYWMIAPPTPNEE